MDRMRRSTLTSCTDSDDNGCTFDASQKIKEIVRKAREIQNEPKPLLREIINPRLKEKIRKNFRRSVVRRAVHPTVVTSTPCVSAAAHQYPNISPIISTSVTDVENDFEWNEVGADNASVNHQKANQKNDQEKLHIVDGESLNVGGLNSIDEQSEKTITNKNKFVCTTGLNKKGIADGNNQNVVQEEIPLRDLYQNKNNFTRKPIHSTEHQTLQSGNKTIYPGTSMPTNRAVKSTKCPNDSEIVSGQEDYSKELDYKVSKQKKAQNKTLVNKHNSNDVYDFEEDDKKNYVHNVISLSEHRSLRCGKRFISAGDEKLNINGLSSGLEGEDFKININDTQNDKNRPSCEPDVEVISIVNNQSHDDLHKSANKDEINNIVSNSIDKTSKKETNQLTYEKKLKSTVENSDCSRSHSRNKYNSRKPETNIVKVKKFNTIEEKDNNSNFDNISSNDSQKKSVDHKINRNGYVQVRPSKYHDQDNDSCSSSFQEEIHRHKSKNKKNRIIDSIHTRRTIKKYKERRSSSLNSEWNNRRRNGKSISKHRRREKSNCRRCTKYRLRVKHDSDSILTTNSEESDQSLNGSFHEDKIKYMTCHHKNFCLLEKNLRKSKRSVPEHCQKCFKIKLSKKYRSKSIARKQDARKTRYCRSFCSDSASEETEDTDVTIVENHHKRNMRRPKVEKRQLETRYEEQLGLKSTKETQNAKFEKSIEKVEVENKTELIKVGNSSCNSIISVQKKSLEEMINDIVSRALCKFKSQKIIDVDVKTLEDDTKINHKEISQGTKAKSHSTQKSLMIKNAMQSVNKTECSLLQKDNIQHNTSSASEFSDFKPSGTSSILVYPEECLPKKRVPRQIARRPFEVLNNDQLLWDPNSNDFSFCFYRNKQRREKEKPIEIVHETTKTIGRKKREKCGTKFQTSRKETAALQNVNSILAPLSSRRLNFRKGRSSSDRRALKANLDNLLGINKNISVIKKEPIIGGRSRIVDIATQSSPNASQCSTKKKRKKTSTIHMMSEVLEKPCPNKLKSSFRGILRQSVATQSSPFITDLDRTNSSIIPSIQSFKDNEKKFNNTTVYNDQATNDYESKNLIENVESSQEEAMHKDKEKNMSPVLFKHPRNITNTLLSSRMQLKFDSEDRKQRKRSMPKSDSVKLRKNSTSCNEIRTSLSKSEANSIIVLSTDLSESTNASNFNPSTNFHDTLLNSSKGKMHHLNSEQSKKVGGKAKIKLLQNITLKKPERSSPISDENIEVLGKTDIGEKEEFVAKKRVYKKQKKAKMESMKENKSRNRISSSTGKHEDNILSEGVRKSTRQRRPPQAIYWKSTLAEEEIAAFEIIDKFIDEPKKHIPKKKVNMNSTDVKKKNTVKNTNEKKEYKAEAEIGSSKKRTKTTTAQSISSTEPGKKKNKLQVNTPRHGECSKEKHGESSESRKPVVSNSINHPIQGAATDKLKEETAIIPSSRILLRMSEDIDPGYVTSSNGTEQESVQHTSKSAGRLSNVSICTKLFKNFLEIEQQMNIMTSPENHFQYISSGNAFTSGYHFGYLIVAPSQAKSAVNEVYDVIYFIVEGVCTLFTNDEETTKEQKSFILIKQGEPYQLVNSGTVPLILTVMCVKSDR